MTVPRFLAQHISIATKRADTSEKTLFFVTLSLIVQV